MKTQLNLLSSIPERYQDYYAVLCADTGQELYVSLEYSHCIAVAVTWNVEVGFWIGRTAIVVNVEEIYPQYLIAEYGLQVIA